MSELIDALAIDDRLVTTNPISHLFQEKNLKVFSLNDITKMLVFLNPIKPNLVIVDMMMPERGGISLCKLIKIILLKQLEIT